MNIPLHVGIKGFVKMEAVNAETGERRLLADWFPNQILLSGMAIMDTRSDWMTWCQVGTSNDAVNEIQQSLQGWYAGTNELNLDIPVATGAQSSTPWYGWKQKVFRFDTALVLSDQVLQEVGVGWGEGAGGSGELISRALIVDINGDPISPAWKVGENLDVTYELRYYPPLNEVNGNIVIDGIGYNYILRALNVAGTTAWASHIGEAMGQWSASTDDWRAYDGDPVDIWIAEPLGLSANCDNENQFNVAVGQSYTIGMGVNCGTVGWNLADPGDGDGPGIRCLRIRSTAGDYQIGFWADGTGGSTIDQRIPKTSSFTMAGQFNLNWNWEEFSGEWAMEPAGAGTPGVAQWNTSVALDRVRINFIDSLSEDIEPYTSIPDGARITITQIFDTTKWVEYTKNGAPIIGADYVEYQVSQTGIGNSGPTVGEFCIISATPL